MNSNDTQQYPPATATCGAGLKKIALLMVWPLEADVTWMGAELLRVAGAVSFARHGARADIFATKGRDFLAISAEVQDLTSGLAAFREVAETIGSASCQIGVFDDDEMAWRIVSGGVSFAPFEQVFSADNLRAAKQDLDRRAVAMMDRIAALKRAMQ